MESVAIAFWGAFFGCAAVAFAAALLAFTRSARRVALVGSLAAMLSALYTLVFLGWVPVDSRELLHRLQALIAIASGAGLAIALFLLLGTFRRPESIARASRVIAMLAVMCFSLAWLAPAQDALGLASVVVAAVTAVALVAAAASARSGESAGWLTLAALLCACVSMAVLNWYAFRPDRTPWPMHAIGAVCGIAYLLCVAVAMWTRYAYLIEVSKVMTHGPNFDPVTRMPSYEAGQPMHELPHANPNEALAMLAVSISNMKMLEELHGRAAYNHALFLCATRLRRMALPGAELVRLREDGFLLVFRHAGDPQVLVGYARSLMQRLSRPVILGTSREIQQLEESGAIWIANVGIGVLMESTSAPLEVSAAGARAMSRTAWSYPSRMAWFDEAAGTIAELPATE
jgi:GGDEF domain-containing protein